MWTGQLSWYKVGIVVAGTLLVAPLLLFSCIFSALMLMKVGFSLYLRSRGLSQKSVSLPPNNKGHVLITGGSSGIGLEVARVYLKLGMKVTIVARDKKKLDLARKDLIDSVNTEISSADVRTISCDVASSEAEVSKALAPAIAAFGDVTILINAAGTSVAGEFDALPADEFERMMRINYLGTIYSTRAVVPAMKKLKQGTIVFVSSQVAQACIHGYTAYGASKWALRGLAEALQMELKPYNILVSVAYPPDTNTPGYQEEMLSKPLLTKTISETGHVFSASDVANDIVHGSTAGYFGISSGFDGWMLKQAHGGMSPFNSALEVTQQVMMASILRFVASFYVLYWDYLVAESTYGSGSGNKPEAVQAQKKKKQ